MRRPRLARARPLSRRTTLKPRHVTDRPSRDQSPVTCPIAAARSPASIARLHRATGRDFARRRARRTSIVGSDLPQLLEVRVALTPPSVRERVSSGSQTAMSSSHCERAAARMCEEAALAGGSGSRLRGAAAWAAGLSAAWAEVHNPCPAAATCGAGETRAMRASRAGRTPRRASGSPRTQRAAALRAIGRRPRATHQSAR
eukprot:7295018-Prymnesium_polylepis.1